MYIKANLQTVINTLAAECKSLFGEKLSDLRLFGSYARGDYDEESDIDVMIVLDMDESEIRRYLDAVCRISSELDMKHGVYLSPLLQSKREYESAKRVSGFYQNIEREGVSVYVG